MLENTLLNGLEQLDISALTKTKDIKDTTKNLETDASEALVFPIRETDFTESTEPTKPKPIESKKSATQTVLEQNSIEPIETSGNQTESKKSPVELLAQFLRDKKLINYEDKDFQDEDNFLSDQLKKSKDNEVQEYKESLPDAIKFLIENYEDGVPLGALLQKEQAEFEYSTIDKDKIKDSPALQQSLITDYLTKIGWTKNEIIEQLKEFEDAGILEKNAIRDLNKLIQIESDEKQSLIQQSKVKKQDQEKLRAKQIKDLQDTINNTKEFIENIPVTDNEKKIVFDSIVKQDRYGRNKVDEFLSDSKNYIKLAYIASILKGDFSKLKTVAKTAAVNSLKDTLSSTSKFSTLNYDNLKEYLNKNKLI